MPDLNSVRSFKDVKIVGGPTANYSMKKILIADDDYFASFALNCMIEQYSLECDEVTHGNAAFDIIV